MTDFVIDQVSWHTKTPGNPESPEAIRRRFRAVVRFLQDNELTARTLLADDDEIDDEFAIRAIDLNETGLALIKKAYDKWVRKIDKGMDADDTTLLKRALDKLSE